MIKNLDFEQNNYSRTAVGIYNTGHESPRLLNWLIFYHRCFYEINN